MQIVGSRIIAAPRLTLAAAAIGLVAAGPRYDVAGQAARYSQIERIDAHDRADCLKQLCIYAAKGRRHIADAAVLIFAGDAHGDFPPHSRIKGTNTDLSFPDAIAVDQDRNVYVANNNEGEQSAYSITVYATGSHGDVAPIQNIVGSNTGLSGPGGIALDVAQNIYVTNRPANSVTVYAAGATGNAAPTATLQGSLTGLNGPIGIGVDSTGAVYVANSLGNSITVYAAGANGNVAPIRTITGSNTGLVGPNQLAVDSSDEIYVANYWGSTLAVFPAGASGNVAPVQQITGSQTQVVNPLGIAVDHARNIYAMGFNFRSGGSTQVILVFPAGANGNVPPARSISGPRTHLDWLVQGLAVR